MREGPIEALAITAQPARRARAADRGDGRDGRLDGRRAARAGAPAGAVRQPDPPGFEGVLDMLAGRYPSDAFAELRPRLVWDRVGGTYGAPGRAAAGRHHRRHHSRPRPVRRLPGAAPTAARRGSANSTRRWSSRGASATSSCSARRPGASRRSPHDRVLVSPAPGSPDACRSGKAMPRDGPSSWAARWARSRVELVGRSTRPPGNQYTEPSTDRFLDEFVWYMEAFKRQRERGVPDYLRLSRFSSSRQVRRGCIF